MTCSPRLGLPAHVAVFRRGRVFATGGGASLLLRRARGFGCSCVSPLLLLRRGRVGASSVAATAALATRPRYRRRRRRLTATAQARGRAGASALDLRRARGFGAAALASLRVLRRPRACAGLAPCTWAPRPAPPPPSPCPSAAGACGPPRPAALASRTGRGPSCFARRGAELEPLELERRPARATTSESRAPLHAIEQAKNLTRTPAPTRSAARRTRRRRCARSSLTKMLSATRVRLSTTGGGAATTGSAGTSTKSAAGSASLRRIRGRRLDAPQRARAPARAGLVVFHGRGVRRGIRLLVREAVLVHRPWRVPCLLGRVVVVVVGAVWCLLGRVVVAVLPGGVLGVERRFALELVVVVHRCYFVRRCSCMQHKRAIASRGRHGCYVRQTRAAMEVPINSMQNVSCSDVAKPRCGGPAAAAC